MLRVFISQLSLSLSHKATGTTLAFLKRASNSFQSGTVAKIIGEAAALLGSTTENDRGPRLNRRIPRLTTLCTPDPSSGVPDAELLARWSLMRDEVAFELLVRRHGPAVLAACRRLLSDSHDADDAFQAAFLVLARKAASVTRSESLAGWLHRVACRIALRLRTDRANHHRRHEPASAVDQLPAPSRTEAEPAELLHILDQELNRLPTRHRIVFVLCCLEGKSGEEAARLLGCPPGTISSRLARARERLRDRLTRRGFAPAAIALVLADNALAQSLHLSNLLVVSIVRSARAFATPGRVAVPDHSATLAEGAIRTMFVQKLKLLPVLFATGLLTVGAVMAGAATEQKDNPPAPRPTVVTTAKAKPAGPSVKLVKPQSGCLDRVIRRTGIARAARQADIIPSATGVLKEVSVRTGDRVKTGQLLATIDAPTLVLDEQLARVALAEAESMMKQAEARVTRAKGEVLVSQGMIELRKTEVTRMNVLLDSSNKKYKNDKRLFDQKVITMYEINLAAGQVRAAETQVAAAKASFENAKADLLVTEAKLKEATAGLSAAAAHVEGAKIGRDKARLALAQTRLTAPFDGIVAVSNAREGASVSPARQEKASPLFTIMKVNVTRLAVWVPARDLQLIKPGLPVQLDFASYQEPTRMGKVTAVSFVVDPTADSVSAEIELPNPSERIRPGMSSTIRLVLRKTPTNEVRLPAGALISTPVTVGEERWDTAVYVYRNGKARFTPVKVSYSNRTECEISSGLKVGDLVVDNPHFMFKNRFQPISKWPEELEVNIEQPKPEK